MTIDEALATLERAAYETDHTPHNTEEVRAALRFLLPHISDKRWLSDFWTSAESENPIGRSQTARASLNGIRLRVRR